MKQAEMLREKSTNGELSREAIEQILSQTPAKAKPIKLSREFCLQYFRKDQTTDEIEIVIA